ncbi:MAG: DUF2461 domain-containing protein [Bdellovibrionota bacterium]
MTMTTTTKKKSQFEGIPKEGFAFLKKLKKNNDRDWFQPRKHEYEAKLKEPMLALIEQLGREMRSIAPEIRFTPKSLLRIYRDTRFAKDKTPYKTHVAATFDMVGYPKSVSSPGFYLHVEPGEVYVGGGLYMPDSRQLKRIRYAIEQKSESFLAIVEDPQFKRFFGKLQGETLKRAPAGYSPEHPMIEYLKRKGFFVGKSFDESLIHSSKAVPKLVDAYTRIVPLTRWLRDNSR